MELGNFAGTVRRSVFYSPLSLLFNVAVASSYRTPRFARNIHRENARDDSLAAAGSNKRRGQLPRDESARRIRERVEPPMVHDGLRLLDYRFKWRTEWSWLRQRNRVGGSINTLARRLARKSYHLRVSWRRHAYKGPEKRGVSTNGPRERERERERERGRERVKEKFRKKTHTLEWTQDVETS